MAAKLPPRGAGVNVHGGMRASRESPRLVRDNLMLVLLLSERRRARGRFHHGAVTTVDRPPLSADSRTHRVAHAASDLIEADSVGGSDKRRDTMSNAISNPLWAAKPPSH